MEEEKEMERRRSDGRCSSWPNEQGLEIKKMAALVLGPVWRPSSRQNKAAGRSTVQFCTEETTSSTLELSIKRDAAQSLLTGQLDRGPSRSCQFLCEYGRMG